MGEPNRVKSFGRSDLKLLHSRKISEASAYAQLAVAWAILTLTTISIPFYFFGRTEIIRWLQIDITLIIGLFIFGLVISFIVYKILTYFRRPLEDDREDDKEDDKELRWNRKVIILISLSLAFLVDVLAIIYFQKNIELIKPLLFLYLFGPVISYFVYQIYLSIDLSRGCYIKATVVEETLKSEKKTFEAKEFAEEIKAILNDKTKYSFPRWVKRNHKRFNQWLVRKIESILRKKSEKKSK